MSPMDTGGKGMKQILLCSLCLMSNKCLDKGLARNSNGGSFSQAQNERGSPIAHIFILVSFYS